MVCFSLELYDPVTRYLLAGSITQYDHIHAPAQVAQVKVHRPVAARNSKVFHHYLAPLAVIYIYLTRLRCRYRTVVAYMHYATSGIGCYK